MVVPSWESVEIALLKEMEVSGGSVDSQKAIWDLPKYFSRLTKDDLSSRLESGALRWANRVRWARQHLVETKELDPSGYGIWKINDKGRKRLAEVWPKWKPHYVDEAPASASPASTTPTLSVSQGV